MANDVHTPDVDESTGFDEAEIDILARHLTASRPALARTYAEVARMTGGLTDFKVVALGQHDIHAAFRAALKEAMQANAHRSLLAELASQGLIDLDAAMSEIAIARESDSKLDLMLYLQDSSGDHIRPEAWDASIARTLDMAKVVDAVHRAARRVCLVQAGAKQGTGFLIGPHTVLTNWHVMAPLIDPATGHARERTAAQISCTFENLAHGQRGQTIQPPDDWLVDFSPLGSGDIDPALDMTGLRPHALDFCVFRLTGAPGRQRGWFDLARTGSLDRENDHFFVFQHPQNFPQRLGIATGAKVDTANSDFLLHDAWTDGGSSGALCMDQKFRPLALHHAGVVDAAGNFRFNRAVRLSAIHAANNALGAADTRFDRISLVNVSAEEGGVRVVVGRGETQDKIHQMMQSPDRPLLYVRGGKRSGKSFTKYLINDCLPFDQRRIVILSAAELPSEARDLAEMILKRAGIPQADIDNLPKPDSPNGTDNAWIHSRLLPEIRLALTKNLRADPERPVVLWLVIDELDIVPVPQTGARELLDGIYADADAMQVLRIVLIGLNAALQGIDPRLTDTLVLDDPEDIGAETIQASLGALMQTNDLAPAPDELKRQAELAVGMARFLRDSGANTNRLERISDILSSVWLKAAKRWT